MARDFRTKQIRTSIVIGSGSVEASKPHLGLVFYSASKASDFEGTRRTGGGGAISNEHKTDTASSYLNLNHAKIGDDVWCLFDGHPAAQGTTRGLEGTLAEGGYPSAIGSTGQPVNSYGSTVLFLGNVTVSGSLYAERQVIEVDNTVPGNFVTPSTSRAYFAGGFHGNGAYNAENTSGGVTIENTGDLRADGFVQTNMIKNHNSSHLTITSETAGNIKFRSKAAGENSGNELDIFVFDVHHAGGAGTYGPSLTIYDDGDVAGDRDYLKIELGPDGQSEISTNEESADELASQSAHIWMSPDGSLRLNPQSGFISFHKDEGNRTNTTTTRFGDFRMTGADLQVRDGDLGVIYALKNVQNGNESAVSLRMDTTKKIEFTDANAYIHAPAAGKINITSVSSAEADALQIEASAGSMLIGSTLAKEKTLTLGNTASTHINLEPSATAANEKILIKNAAGDTEASATTGAIKIEAAAGGITLDAQKDIRLSADGGNIIMDDGTKTIFDFDVDGSTPDTSSHPGEDGKYGPSLTIYDDYDGTAPRDFFKIELGPNGQTEISTNDDFEDHDPPVADLMVSPDGSLLLNPETGVISFHKAAANRGALLAGGGTRYGDFQMFGGKDLVVRDGGGSPLYTLINVVKGNNDPKSVRIHTNKKIEFHDASQFIHAPSDTNLTIKAPSAITLETDQYGAICTRPEGIHLGNAARNAPASVSGNNSKVRIFVATGSMNKASAYNSSDPFDQLGTNGVITGITDGALVFSNRSAISPTVEPTEANPNPPEDFASGRIAFDGQVVMGALDVDNLTVVGSLRVQGTTTTLNTETITSTDPVISIGGVQVNPENGAAGEEDDVYSSTVTAAAADKDRGIEMNYWDGAASRTAFMGIDPSTNPTFNFYHLASQNNGEWSGTPANGRFKGVFLKTAGDIITAFPNKGISVFPQAAQGFTIECGPEAGNALIPRLTLSKADDTIAQDDRLGQIYFGGGSVLPNGTDIQHAAGIEAVAADAWRYDADPKDCPGQLKFFTRPADYTGDGYYRMTIDENGDVGIGTQSPTAQLEVRATSTQQKWSYDGGSSVTMTVADSSHTTLATAENGNVTIDAGGGILLDAHNGVYHFKREGAEAFILKTEPQSDPDLKTDVLFKVKDDESIIDIFRLDTSAQSLLMATDKKIEFYNASQYINAPSNQTLRIAAATNIYMTCDGLYLDSNTELNFGAGNARFVHSNNLFTSDSELRAPKFSIDDANSYIAHASSDLEIVTDGGIVLNAGGGDITLKDDSNVAFSINTSTANTGVIKDQAGHEVFRITNDLVRMASGKKIEFADAGESIHGDGNDLILSSGRHVNLAGSSAQLNFGSSDHRIYLDSNVLKFRDSEVTTPLSLERLAEVSPANGTLFSIGDSGEKRAKSTGGMVISSRDKYMTQTEIYGAGMPNPSDLFFYVGDDAGVRTNSAFKNNVVISGSLHMADNTLDAGNNPLTTGRVSQNAGQTIFTTTINNGSGVMSSEEHFWLKPGTAGVGGMFLHANRMLAFSDNQSSGDVSLNIQRVLHTVEGNASQKCMQHKGHIIPQADNAFNLGTADRRFANLYTGDLHLNNMGSSNDVDGTSGNWTIQEGEDSLYVINNLTGKRFKMMLQPVDDGE